MLVTAGMELVARRNATPGMPFILTSDNDEVQSASAKQIMEDAPAHFLSKLKKTAQA